MPSPRYITRALIQSFTNPEKKYTIKRKDDGSYSCSCPSWIFNHSGDRMCKHLRAVLENENGILKLILFGSTRVLDVKGEKFTVMDMDPHEEVK